MTGQDVIKRLYGIGVFKDFDARRFVGLLNEFVPELMAQYYDGNHRAGVYVWRDGADDLYVGQSKRWDGRLASHLVNMLANDRDPMYLHFRRAHQNGTLSVEVRRCPAKELDDRERALICELATPKLYNKKHNPLRKLQ